jgi:uncharacterized membrane protein
MGDKMEMMALILVTTAAVLGGVAQVLLKKGMNDVGKVTLVEMAKQFIRIIFTNPYVFVGLTIYVISTVIYLAALSRGELNVVYPIISISYIVAAILSVFFLNEKITLVRWVGIFTIVAGVIMVVWK